MRVSVKLCLTGCEASGLAAAVEKDDGKGFIQRKPICNFVLGVGFMCRVRPTNETALRREKCHDLPRECNLGPHSMNAPFVRHYWSSDE
jgi:hypothetical protein